MANWFTHFLDPKGVPSKPNTRYVPVQKVTPSYLQEEPGKTPWYVKMDPSKQSTPTKATETKKESVKLTSSKKVTASSDKSKETTLPKITVKGKKPTTPTKKVIASTDKKKETTLPEVTVKGKKPIDKKTNNSTTSTKKPVNKTTETKATPKVEVKKPVEIATKQPYKNPDGMNNEKVKQMQAKIGLDVASQDGKWGLKTQAAFEKYRSTDNQPLMSMNPIKTTNVPSTPLVTAMLDKIRTPQPNMAEQHDMLAKRPMFKFGGKIDLANILSIWKK